MLIFDINYYRLSILPLVISVPKFYLCSALFPIYSWFIIVKNVFVWFGKFS